MDTTEKWRWGELQLFFLNNYNKNNKKNNKTNNEKNIKYSLLGPAWESAQRHICLNYLP